MKSRFWWIGAAAALVSGQAAFAAGFDKEAAHVRMAALEAQAAVLKSQPAQRSAYVATQSELQALSARLGGDLPCARPGPGEATAPAKGVGSVPPAPTGCTATTTAFTNTTPVEVPTGPAVVTSTLIVSGAGAYLWDVDATTFLPHSFSADLDVTLTSPAGTVVTLTTDNAAGNDNVFNGTVWDDSADPGGAVPYATNDGLVTDHAFANLVVASPLVPEEPLAAFVGEDPNGTWTITISDDLAGDGGSLDSWSLSLTTFAAAPNVSAPQVFTQATAVPLADVAVTTSTIDVSGLPAPVCNAVLRTTLAHSFSADLDVTLTSPAGTVVTLTTDNAAGNDNVFNGTAWHDDANPAGQVPYTTNDGVVTDTAFANLVTATPLAPEESMGAFLGQDGNGTWTLSVSDDLAGDTGSLDGWELEFRTCSCQRADLSLGVVGTPDPVPVGEEIDFAITLGNAGPDAAADVVFDTSTPAGTTFVSLAVGPGFSCVTPPVGATGAIQCTGATLAAGDSIGLTITVDSDDALADGTAITLASSAASSTADGNGADNTVDETVLVTAAADVGVTLVDTPDPVTAGSALTYTATATNAGPAVAADLELTLPLPPGTRFAALAASAGSICTQPAVGSGGTVTCGWAGSTDTATPRSMDVSVTVDAATAPGTVLSATASVSSASPDGVGGNDDATATTTIAAAQTDLAISKDDGSTTATAGGSTVYTIVASNLGPTGVTGATVTDTLPATLACSWTATFAGGATGTAAGSGSLAESIDLPAGASATYTLDCDIADAAAGSLANTASIAAPATVVDTDAGNDSATDSNTIDGAADLSVVATADVTDAVAEDTVVYTVVASNDGPSDVADAALAFDVPDDFFCAWSAAYAGGASGAAGGSDDIAQTLVLPAAGTATFTVTCEVDYFATPGARIATATIASAAVEDPVAANDASAAELTVGGTTRLRAEKTVSTAAGVQPGDVVTYTIVLRNFGTLAQADNPGDELVDVLPAGLTGVSATATAGTAVLAGNTVTWNGALAPGAEVTLTIAASIDDDASGLIVNQATINFDADGDGSNETSDPSDDPDTKESSDPTGFEVEPGTVVPPPPPAAPSVIPATDTLALFALGLLLLGLGWRRRPG